MQLYNVIKQPLIECFKEEFKIDRDVLGSVKITFLDVKILRKMNIKVKHIENICGVLFVKRNKDLF